MPTRIEFRGVEEQFDQLTDRLGEMDITLRSKATEKLLRDAARIVKSHAKQTVPQPGYPGDKAGFKALRDTIGIRVKQYQRAWVAIIGPRWPAGAHGHNVEFGHRIRVGHGRKIGRRFRPGQEGRIVGRTTPRLFMQKAMRLSRQAAQSKLSTGVVEVVRKIWTSRKS